VDAMHNIEQALAGLPASIHAPLRALLGQPDADESAGAALRAAVARAAADGFAHAETLAAIGARLAAAGRPFAALAALECALDARPDLAGAQNNRGCVLLDLGRDAMSLACFDTAIALKPDFAVAWSNRANALRSLGRAPDALASYDRAIALQPDFADAWSHRGVLLARLQRFEDAIASQERALALQPDHRQAFAELLHCKSRICDWRGREDLIAQARRRILDNTNPPDPFVVLRYLDEPDLLLRAARLASARHRAPALARPAASASARGRRLRLAYISADYRAHPTTHLIAHLIESHDRDRFEVLGVSYGPDDASPMRRRMERAFDRVLDIRGLSDRAAAQKLADAGVDIAVDLMGHTPGARPGVLASRPAPVQVNFLGFAGSLGADWIDYMIVDPVVAPPGCESGFQERLARLPDVYQPSDAGATIGPTPSRAAVGLPDDGFVFACFNSNLKIGPETFALWMRLLRRVEGAVLWLMQDHPSGARRLQAAAAAEGVDPGRLVFAPRAPLDAHLARQRCADLFLDTFPYGAHTTASDALWAGLPVVTALGPAFAGRVAASLAIGAGLPELVADDSEAYVRIALDLARDREKLAAFRARLSSREGPLFDRPRYRRALEAAFVGMWEQARGAVHPRPFAS